MRAAVEMEVAAARAGNRDLGGAGALTVAVG